MIKSKLQIYSYDVILVTSSPLRHWKRHQNNATIFSNLGPPPIKISGYANVST